MGGITEAHIEWAIVNRLKAMLDEPPTTAFNVTQSFALFGSVLLWTKNRAWVAGNKTDGAHLTDPDDQTAHAVRVALRNTKITDEPWRLPLAPPTLAIADALTPPPPGINGDFREMTAEDFFTWLRNALAHGDGRTIHPLHKRSRRDGSDLLAGFRIVFEKERGSATKLELHLYHDDLRRIGAELAHQFCKALSGGEDYFGVEVGTADLAEPASVA